MTIKTGKQPQFAGAPRKTKPDLPRELFRLSAEGLNPQDLIMMEYLETTSKICGNALKRADDRPSHHV